MGDAADIRNAYNWNVSSIARAFNLHRNTVSGRVKEAGIQPVGRQGNAPLYALADVGPALFGMRDAGGSVIDPNELPPQDRLAWFRSETERQKFEEAEKHLVPDDEVAREMSMLVKAIANGLDTLPDVLERECGLTADVLDTVQAKIDALRESIYDAASE